MKYKLPSTPVSNTAKRVTKNYLEFTRYNNKPVVIKSILSESPRTDLIEFTNEIVTFQMLQTARSDRCSPYVAQFVGYMLFQPDDPFVGSLVIEHYMSGDLLEYSYKKNQKYYDSFMKKWIDIDLFDANQFDIMDVEIEEFSSLVKQIAEGIFRLSLKIFIYIIKDRYF